MPKIYKMRIDRLEEFGISPFEDEEPWWINYDNKISVYGLLSRIKTENTFMYTELADEWTAADHARRIKYLANHPQELNKPIRMLSYPAKVKDPIPIIDDGWHRLYAHYYLGRKYINATWRGTKKLLDYLTGVSTY